jgi:hypothetical protein
MTDLSNRKPETGAFFSRDRLWHPPGLTPGYKTSVLRSPQKALLSLDGTVSEITGPVFGHAISRRAGQRPDPQFRKIRRKRHRGAHHRAWPGARRAGAAGGRRAA